MTYALLVLAMLAAGCGSGEPPPPPDATPPEGRAETQSIRNTGAVGTNGKAIADKVDEAIKVNDENAKRVEKEATEQEGYQSLTVMARS
jgi:hypothetical protein